MKFYNFVFLYFMFIQLSSAQTVTLDTSGNIRSYVLKGRFWNSVGVVNPNSSELIWSAQTLPSTNTKPAEINNANNFFTYYSQTSFSVVLPSSLSSTCQIMSLDAQTNKRKLRVNVGIRSDKHFVAISCNVE